MKPRIGVDLDGVVVDLARYALHCVNDELGTHYKYEDRTTYRAKDCFPPDVAKIFQKVVYHPATYRVLRPIDGAIPALHMLAKKADIIIVTSRPANCASPTYDWLSSYRVPAIGLIMAEDKAGYAEALGLEAFIDDKLETAVSMVDVVPLPILVEQPWNNYRLENRLFRVKDWENALALLECFL